MLRELSHSHRCRSDRWPFHSPVRFKIFQPQLQLLDLLVELLGTASELHPLQLRNQKLQIFDFIFVTGVIFLNVFRPALIPLFKLPT